MKIPVKIYDKHLGIHKDFGVHEIEDLDDLMEAIKHWGLVNSNSDDLEADDMFGQFHLSSGSQDAFFEITSV